MQDTSSTDAVISGFADTLLFGIDLSATLCLDPALGENELPPRPPSGVYDVRFSDINAAVPCLGQGVRVNYQPIIANTQNEFGLLLQNGETEGKSMRFRWDTASVHAGWTSLVLTNDLTMSVDMMAVDSALVTRTQYLNKVMYIRGTPRPRATPRFGIVASAGPGGSVAPNGTVMVDSGASQFFSFLPALGHQVDSVIVDGVYVGTPSAYLFPQVVAPHVIVVKFRAITYHITAIAGPGGTITPSGSVPVTAGSNQSFSIQPDLSYGLDSLLVDGIRVGQLSTYTFTNVLADHTIRAVFRGPGVATEGVVNVSVLQDTSATDGLRKGLSVDLLFGVYPSATMCYDEALGEHELPPAPPSGVFDARFIDDYLPAPCLGQGSLVHLQPPSADPVSVFGFMLRAAEASSKEMVLRWDRVAVANDWDSLVVTNGIGVTVDMRSVDTAVFARTQYVSRILYFRGGRKAAPSPAYVILASAGPGGAIVPSGAIPVDSGATQAFLIQPVSGYELDSLIVDDAAVSPVFSYSFASVDRGHSIRAVFRAIEGAGTLYRTLNFSDFTTKRAVKHSPVSYRFSVPLVNTTPNVASGLGIWFGGTSRNAVQIDSVWPFSSSLSFDAKEWTFTGGSVAPGETVWVTGRCAGAPVEILRWRWAYPTGATREGRFRTATEPPGQIPLYPMPNGANVREEVFDRLGMQGIVVGAYHPELPMSYGWVRLNNGNRLRNSLLTNARRHLVTSGCFRFHREKKVLTPYMEDNATFAALAMLKMNIAASALGITPAGLGELVYADTVATEFNGATVSEIAAIADSLLSGRYVGATHECASLETFSRVTDLLTRINDAFVGPFDTASFASALVLTGVRNAETVGFLHHLPGSVPKRIEPVPVMPTAMPPNAFHLAQNYPNPFNPTTTIDFQLPWDANVTLTIYNPLGQEVATLYRGDLLTEGVQEVVFHAGALGSGVYYYRLTAVAVPEEDEVKPETLIGTGKMLLLK